MARKTGRIIMILGIVICVLAFGAFISISISYFNNTEARTALFYGIAFIILALLSLLGIIPFLLIGKLGEEIDRQNQKYRSLSDKVSRLEKAQNANGNSSNVSQFSPINRIQTGGISIEVPTQTRIPIKTNEIMKNSVISTAEFTKTIEAPRINTNEFKTIETNKPSIDIESLVDNNKREVELAFASTTTSIDKFSINRKFNTVTKSLPVLTNTTIAAGAFHTVVLLEDGTVMAIGSNEYGQCDVEDWDNVCGVAAGLYHTVAVKNDGTCVSTGYIGVDNYDVSSWTDVFTIACGKNHTVGLLQDGTCVATGDNTFGQCNVRDWSNIISITAGDTFSIGLKADGTLVSTNTSNVNSWGGITKVAAGGFHVVGLKTEGTLIATGNNANGQCDVKPFKNIKQIAAGMYHTVGVTENGLVYAIGANASGQCNVKDWRDVVAIAAGRNHTIGLTEDGRILSVGDDTYGQCGTKSIKDVRVIKTK